MRTISIPASHNYPVLAKITQNRGKSPGKGVFLPHFAFTGGFPALTTSANVVQITASAGNAFFQAILADSGRIWPDSGDFRLPAY